MKISFRHPFSAALILVPVLAGATLTPSVQRGEQTIAIQGRSPMICVIPTHLFDAKYSKGDLEMEQALCSLQEDVNMAICPKLASTNPGIEFFSVPAPYTIAQAEKANCFLANPADKKDNLLKKRAKYKNSTSCSYTPSILAYYHVSRLLNDAGNVPPAVVRTFDLSRHLEIARTGVDVATAREGSDAVIAQTWKSLLSALNAGPAAKKKDALFTDDFNQTYGAIQQNPTNEDKYSDMFTKAAYGDPRTIAFRDSNAIFAQVKSSKPASAFAGTQFTQSNVQTIMQMKAAADMVVLDTLLSQEDRMGNVHYKNRYAYIDPSNVGTDGNAKVQFESKLKPEIAAFKPVIVKEIMLKDNDCGVNRDNRSMRLGLLPLVAHMDPKTYRGILKVDAGADDAGFTKVFKSGMMFTGEDYAKMRGNLSTIVSTLKARCKSGALKLDLDLDAHFAGKTVANKCEL